MKTTLFPQLTLFLLVTLQSSTLKANDIGMIDLAQALSKKQLVSNVLNANPQLEVALATWQAALANIDQQSSFDDPQFQYSFAPLTANSYQANGQKADFGQKFEVSQKLPFPGKLDLRAKSAAFHAETKQHNITSLQLLLASTAKSLFADWYFIHQAILINQQQQQLSKELVDVAINQYSTGKINKQTVLQTKGQLAQVNHHAISLMRQKKTRQAQLNTLLNRPVDSPLAKPQPLSNITDLPTLKQLQIFAMQSRPELKAISANIKGYQSATDLATLAYYPDLKLSVGYNTLWDNQDKRFNIGIGINIPLSQSKRRAAEQQAKAYSQQANWQQIDLQAKIKQELAINHANTEEALHVLQLYHQQLLPLANEKLATVKTDFQSGKASYLDLIRAKKSKLQTQLEAEQALTNLHRHFAALEQAVGSIAPLSALTFTGINAE